MAQFELAIEDAGGKCLQVPVNTQGIVIGRSPEADVRIDHPRVSRAHVRVRAAGDSLALEYLGSRGGIKVNGKRVNESALSHGDQFVVGDHTVVVSDLERGPANQATEVPEELINRFAANRLRMKRDPRIRKIFERACLLTVQQESLERTACTSLELVLDITGAHRAFFLMLNGGDGVKIAGSLAREGRKSGPNLNGQLIATAVATGAPTLKVDERPLPAEAQGDRPAAICHPLKRDGHVVAAVYADSGWDDGDFDSHLLQDFRALMLIVGPTILDRMAADA